MNEKLNLLFFSDIKKHLKNENVEYLAIPCDELYEIERLPLTFNEYFSILRDYMCYNYDNLSDINKEIYKNEYRTFIKIDDKRYKQDIKIYKFKNKK